MAKRKKQSSKVQKRKGAKARPKTKKLSKARRGKAVAKGAAARTKPKRAPVKKAPRPVALAVETVAVEVIKQPACLPLECSQDRMSRFGSRAELGARPHHVCFTPKADKRRLERKRYRPRILARRHAGELHAQEERHSQPDALGKARSTHLGFNRCRMEADRKSRNRDCLGHLGNIR